MRECFSVSVLVPVYNEENTIVKLLERLEGCACVDQIVVVDDGSRDRTLQLVQEWAGQVRGALVTIIRHACNRGKGAAVRTALGTATGSHVVVQDGDLEYCPADLERLAEACERAGGQVCIYGSRFLKKSLSSFAALGHVLGNRVLTWLCNRLGAGRLHLTDMATCYKMIPRRLLERIDLSEDGFGFDPEVTMKLAARGAEIREVPINYAGRSAKEGKKIRWRDGLLYVRCLWKNRINHRAAGALGETPEPQAPLGKRL